MIKSDDHLHQTREELAKLEGDLAALQREVYSVNPQRFHLMAEAYVDHIMDLRNQIDEYVGIKLYQDQTEELWIRLIGPAIQLGTASAALLASTVDDFRKSIRSIAAILRGEKPYKRGGVSQDTEKACDLVIMGLAAGSLKIGLGLPPEHQASLFENNQDPAERAIDTFMDVVSWSSSVDQTQKLPDTIESLPSRDYILRQVMKIAPSKKDSVKAIEFSGALVHAPKLPILTVASKKRLHDILARETDAEYMEAIGKIREIDLDDLCFDLRERPDSQTDLKCIVSEDLLDDAKTALGESVRVAGTIARDDLGRLKTLKVKTLDVLSDEEQ